MLLTALVAVLGLVGGVPEGHPDLVTPQAFHALDHRGHPYFFIYPGLVTYLVALAYGLAYLVLALTRALSVEEFLVRRDQGVLIDGMVRLPFEFPGHLVIAVCAVVGALATYRLACAATEGDATSPTSDKARASPALLGAMVVVLAPLWVASAHMVTVDLPASALGVAAVALAARARTDRPGHAPLLAGAAAGLAAAAKYPLALHVLPIAASFALAPGDTRTRLLRASLVLASAAAAFGLSNPYLLLEPGAAWADLRYDWLQSRAGHFGFPSSGFWHHLTASLHRGVGLGALLVAAWGGLAILRAKTMAQGRKLLLAGFPVLYFPLIASSTLGFERYALPLVPFVGVWCSVALSDLAARLARSSARRVPPAATRILAVAAALVLLLDPLTTTLRMLAVATRADTRQDLRLFLRGLAAEAPAAQLACPGYAGRALRSGPRAPAPPDPCTGTDAAGGIVVDSFTFDRVRSDPRWHLMEPATRAALPTLAALSRYSHVVTLSPFSRDRAQVPDSAEALYGLSREDLVARIRPGPYVEIYLDDRLGQVARTTCLDVTPPCHVRSAATGYFREVFATLDVVPASSRPSLQR